MSDSTGHSTRASSLASPHPRAAGTTNESSITYVGDVSSSCRSTPRGPNIDKDLPRIPSTSTGLWNVKSVTASSEMMASPMTSPTPDLPPLPVPQNLKRTATTEAQKIAAQYRQRYGSLEALRSEVSCPPRLEVSSRLVSDTPFVSPHRCRG